MCHSLKLMKIPILFIENWPNVFSSDQCNDHHCQTIVSIHWFRRNIVLIWPLGIEFSIYLKSKLFSMEHKWKKLGTSWYHGANCLGNWLFPSGFGRSKRNWDTLASTNRSLIFNDHFSSFFFFWCAIWLKRKFLCIRILFFTLIEIEWRRKLLFLFFAQLGHSTDFDCSRDRAKEKTWSRRWTNVSEWKWEKISCCFFSLLICEGQSLIFGRYQWLDFELEMASFLAGKGNHQGEPMVRENANDRLFVLVLINDWSAWDIQKWEYFSIDWHLGDVSSAIPNPFLSNPKSLLDWQEEGIQCIECGLTSEMETSETRCSKCFLLRCLFLFRGSKWRRIFPLSMQFQRRKCFDQWRCSRESRSEFQPNVRLSYD